MPHRARDAEIGVARRESWHLIVQTERLLGALESHSQQMEVLLDRLNPKEPADE